MKEDKNITKTITIILKKIHNIIFTSFIYLYIIILNYVIF